MPKETKKHDWEFQTGSGGELPSDLTMEEAFSRLDQLLSELDSEENSLETTFEKYKEGLALVRFCEEKVRAIEQQLQTLENEDTDDRS